MVRVSIGDALETRATPVFVIVSATTRSRRTVNGLGWVRLPST